MREVSERFEQRSCLEASTRAGRGNLHALVRVGCARIGILREWMS